MFEVQETSLSCENDGQRIGPLMILLTGSLITKFRWSFAASLSVSVLALFCLFVLSSPALPVS